MLHDLILKAKRQRIHTICLDNVLPFHSTLYTRFGFKYQSTLDNAMYLHVKNYTPQVEKKRQLTSKKNVDNHF